MSGNPLQLNGIEFVEFSSPNPGALRQLFLDFGFSKVSCHQTKRVEYFKQNNINFIINDDPGSKAAQFSEIHGPSICSMGWRVADAHYAFELAVARGAKPASDGDYFYLSGEQVPAIYGIGGSLIYYIEDYRNVFLNEGIGFQKVIQPDLGKSKGFISIDHLTNNIEADTMEKWVGFYKNIFGFSEVRYFDIRGVKTGLQSFALRSPCGSFCIPINEAKEENSQINEYLIEYNGPGIQHLAFLTTNILNTLQALKGTKIDTLDIDDDYYGNIFERVPNVTEDHQAIRDYRILVDGDEQGYLLQIFTKTLIGPIFIEIIQRKNHSSFGEGNFGALFRSIERDQMKRGVVK